LSEVLLTEYPPGAPIGWHRDAPGFGIIVGISLLSACRMRFRRGAAPGTERLSVPLEPRSAYVLSGPARSEWQHSIPEVDTLRYSITFRTLAS
jgi:alkylated DNA repair dioxygenase AlkB